MTLDAARSDNFLPPAAKPSTPVPLRYSPTLTSFTNAKLGDVTRPSPSFKLPVERSEPPAVTVNIWVPISFILTLCCSKASVRATLTAGILD